MIGYPSVGNRPRTIAGVGGLLWGRMHVQTLNLGHARPGRAD
jgi:hypothetical protein